MCIFGYLFSSCLPSIKCLSFLPFMPYEPTPDNEIQHMRHEKWMEYVGRAQPNMRIKDMTIPATHDVGTYALSSKTALFFTAKTQRLSIYDQMKAGSRNLDLRYGGIGKDPNEVYTLHGPFKGCKIEVALEQISRFMTENPKEFAIVTFQYEQDLTQDQKHTLVNLIRKYLTPRAITSSDSWFNIDTVTIGEVQAYNKNLFVLADHPFLLLRADYRDTDPVDYGSIGVFPSFDYYQSGWADVETTEQLFRYALRHLEKDWRQKETFIGTQMILTFQSSAEDILDYVIGEESLRIDHFTKLLHKKKTMANFFVDHCDTKPFNFIELDYIDYNPNLTRFIIGLNFPFRLLVLSATIGGKDCTDLMRSSVKKGRAIYLTDISQKMQYKGSKNSTLRIEFQYEGDNSPTIKEFNISDISNEFLLTYIDMSQTKTQRSSAKRTAPIEMQNTSLFN